MSHDTVATLEDVVADVEIDDSSAITVAVQYCKADLRVQTPDPAPLSTAEPHLTLALSSDETSVEIDLDGEDLDALADALHRIQSEFRERGSE